MKKVDPFYCSDKWHRARNRALALAHMRCSLCSISVKGRRQAHIHHIQPRSTHPHLELDINNLQVLCSSCHNRIHDRNNNTIKSVKISITGVDGFPVDGGWS